jgi:hypothetical protein
MLRQINCLLRIISFCGLICFVPNAVVGQNSVSEFHKILFANATFNETDFAALRQGQTVVRLLPATDKREVAVCGLVSLGVTADMFLESFRESMTKKSDHAILEIGRFSNTPTLADLQTLSFEERDIEDLKQCLVGDCKLKLSRQMIERLQTEVNWQAPDYRIQATQLLKRMLSEYVSDYLARGDAALIEYTDKSTAIRLADEQRALLAASNYIANELPDQRPHLKRFAQPEMSLVENAIVWSKIKFGLKPVIAFNHIKIYKRERGSGPQVLIASRQIYANHYFDSSLALTAFVNFPGATPAAYLIYENRSRADGLQGAFGKIKRGIVEGKAVASLKTILEGSKANLNARALNAADSAQHVEERSWRPWKVGRVHLFLSLLLITACFALFALRNYRWNLGPPASRPH